MAIDELSSALQIAGRYLPELALKSTLVLGVAGVLAFLLRRRSAAVRHIVWTTAVAGVLALPFTHLIPVRIAVLPASLAGAQVARDDAAPAVSQTVEEAAPSPRTVAEPVREAPAASAWWPADVDRTTLMVGVWLLVASVLVLRVLAGTAMVWWLARSGERMVDGEWTAAADRISRTFDAPSARLIRTRWSEMPMTWGFIRPVVLLPADCDEWPAERRDVVLRHELAHVARRDVATLALAQLACAVHWFNPLAWLALHQLRAEAERCCDDAVLSTGTRASAYAAHLLEMVRLIGRARVPAAVALPMAQRSTFEGRLLAILEPGVERGTPGRARTALTMGGLLAVVAAVGAMRPVEAITADLAAIPAAPGRVEARVVSAKVAEKPPAAPAVLSVLPRSVPAPIAALKDASAPAIQQAASAAAQAAADAQAAVTPQVEAKAQATVTQSSAGAVVALVAALRDADGTVRLSAIRALGSLHDPRAVQALIEALRTDSDATVRNTAAWALGEIESRAATAALVQAMASDRSIEVRRTATWALGQIEDPAAVDGLARAVRDPDTEVRETAVWALGEIESRTAVPALSSVLREGDVAMRRLAAWALGQIEAAEAVPALAAALRDSDREVRETAVWALGEIESADAVPALTTVLGDSDPRVRNQAAWALGQIEAESGVAPLSRVLQGDSDASVRQTAAWALGEIERESAMPALTAALRDRVPAVRATAAWAIGQVEPDRAPAELSALLRDDDQSVRANALWALGQTRDVAAIEPLLRDPNPEVRRAAARALGGGPDPRPRPRPQPRPRPRPRPMN
ncbi:MAG TPA: M56 family metallopeptidase [Longimicrobium sp.]|jgi:HEAT repeat protein/beta-lactamase regulating signal transducer with metallopeptidase domain